MPTGHSAATARGVCVLPENPTERTLFRDMSAFENMAFAALCKVSGAFMKRRYLKSLRRSCVDLVGEEITACPDIGALNAEALQMLVYTKWLIYGPRVLVLQKPFSATDPSLRRVTQRLLKPFIERGVAILALTTHRSEARMVSGRFLAMEDGRIKQGYSL